jgi:hypothetical protein
LHSTSIFVASAWLAACSADHPAAERLAEVSIAVAAAPAEAICLQVDVRGSRAVNVRFSRLLGKSTIFHLSDLPVGPVVFTAFAFESACKPGGAPSVADYVADPVEAVLQAGLNARLTLRMRTRGLRRP